MLIASPDGSLTSTICSWIITVPTDKTINLRFIDFNLEASVNCEASSLQIFDGPNTHSTIFGSKLCGPYLPDNIESTGNNLFLLLKKTAKRINENEFKIKVNYKGNHNCYQLISKAKNIMLDDRSKKLISHPKFRL